MTARWYRHNQFMESEAQRYLFGGGLTSETAIDDFTSVERTIEVSKLARTGLNTIDFYDVRRRSTGVNSWWELIRRVFSVRYTPAAIETAAEAILESLDDPESFERPAPPSGEPGPTSWALAHGWDISNDESSASVEEPPNMTVEVPKGERIRRRHRFAGYVARLLQLEFGYPKRTEANRAMFRRTALKIFQEHGVTNTDSVRIIDITIELAFVKSKDYLFAERFRNTRAVQNRQYDMTTRAWYGWFVPSRYEPYSLPE